MQQEKLRSVSDLNDFVELCCGEFFGRCVKLQPSLLILVIQIPKVVFKAASVGGRLCW